MNEDKDALVNVDEQEQKAFSASPDRSKWKTVVLFIVAAILIFVFVNGQLSARSAGYTKILPGGSCCGSENSAETGRASGSVCCGTGESSDTDFEGLRQAGLDFYTQNYGDGPVEAVVEDYGCHQEIHIYREGQLVNRLISLNGEIREL